MRFSVIFTVFFLFCAASAQTCSGVIGLNLLGANNDNPFTTGNVNSCGVVVASSTDNPTSLSATCDPSAPAPSIVIQNQCDALGIPADHDATVDGSAGTYITETLVSSSSNSRLTYAWLPSTDLGVSLSTIDISATNPGDPGVLEIEVQDVDGNVCTYTANIPSSGVPTVTTSSVGVGGTCNALDSEQVTQVRLIYTGEDAALQLGSVTSSPFLCFASDCRPRVGDLMFSTDDQTPLVVSSILGLLSDATDSDGGVVALNTPVDVDVPNFTSITGTLSADGSFTYTPVMGNTGTFTFTYTVDDDTMPTANTSNVGTVTIVVTAAAGGTE